MSASSGNASHILNPVRANDAEVTLAAELRALRLNAAALEAQNVQVVREFSAVPLLLTEKHKVLQILVNLVTNAIQAMGKQRSWPRSHFHVGTAVATSSMLRACLVNAGPPGAETGDPALQAAPSLADGRAHRDSPSTARGGRFWE